MAPCTARVVVVSAGQLAEIDLDSLQLRCSAVCVWRVWRGGRAGEERERERTKKTRDSPLKHDAPRGVVDTWDGGLAHSACLGVAGRRALREASCFAAARAFIRALYAVVRAACRTRAP